MFFGYVYTFLNLFGWRQGSQNNSRNSNIESTATTMTTVAAPTTINSNSNICLESSFVHKLWHFLKTKGPTQVWYTDNYIYLRCLFEKSFHESQGVAVQALGNKKCKPPYACVVIVSLSFLVIVWFFTLASDLSHHSPYLVKSGQKGYRKLGWGKNIMQSLEAICNCLSLSIYLCLSVSLSHSLAHSLTHSFIHSLIHSLTQSHSLIHSRGVQTHLKKRPKMNTWHTNVQQFTSRPLCLRTQLLSSFCLSSQKNIAEIACRIIWATSTIKNVYSAHS